MIYPRRCPECGEEIKPLLDKEVDVIIPTCTGCGEGFIDEETAEALDETYNGKESKQTSTT